MTPAPDLCGTGYLLASPGREYLAYQDGSLGEFSIDLRNGPGVYEVIWYDPTNSQVAIVPGKPITGGDSCILTTPFPGPAAVHLKRTED